MDWRAVSLPLPALHEVCEVHCGSFCGGDGNKYAASSDWAGQLHRQRDASAAQGEAAALVLLVLQFC